MMNPASPTCGPAACLRAEAEDLRERAERMHSEADNYQRIAERQRQEAAAHLDLAKRYDAAASTLEAATDAAEPYLADTGANDEPAV